MPAPAQHWTAEQVRAMQDESRPWPRYELIDGELLVSPGPRWEHQRAVYRLARALDDYVRPHRLGEVLMSPADLELEPDHITQPDVFVVPESERQRPVRWANVKRLLVAAEVLSPSTARYDRVKKRQYYQRRGVPEYWVVDIDARLVERWHPGEERPEVLDEAVVWHPEGGQRAVHPPARALLRGGVGRGAGVGTRAELARRRSPPTAPRSRSGPRRGRARSRRSRLPSL